MNRRKIIAGNWKMNKELEEGISLASEVAKFVEQGFETRTGEIPLVIMAPPCYLLSEAVTICDGVPGVAVAAQNASSEVSGAFTGEISAGMLRSVGAEWVIIGHSERRTIFGEDDALLARKASRVVNEGLGLIFCVGEVLNERLDGSHFDVVKRQLKHGVFHLDDNQTQKLVIAYEPVWAIGTGHNATPEQAGEMHTFIRDCLAEQYGHDAAVQIPILYGGSCKPDNAAGLFAKPDVDGGLIGGASLNAGDFAAIIKSI
ncbi:MAG: triose-phosphate isomerase [Bacteroidales bacterium]